MENEIILREENGIVYEILQENDLDETATVLSEVFTGGEPVTMSQDITPKEFHYFAEIYCKKAITDGVSIIAKDEGKIIAFVISEDFDSEQPEGIDKIDIKLVPLMALVDEIEKDMKSNKKEGEKRFHMFLGGTDKQHEGKHIGHNLIEESMKLAKIKNFTSVIVEPSGFKTQHIFNILGFVQKGVIDYRSFQYNGENVFKNIVGPVGLPIMEKEL